MTSRALVAVSAMTAALLSGCGSSKTDEGPASAGALCQAYSSSLTSRLSACAITPLPDVVLGIYASALFDCPAFQAAQDAGRISFDRSRAQACLDALGAMSCSQLQAGGVLFPAACVEAVAPKVAPGGACFSRLGYECLGGWCDLSAATCTTGATCEPFALLGESCVTATCGPGLLCDAGSVCAVKPITSVVGLGASCASVYSACGAGLYCDGTTKICTARKALGAACNGLDQCVEGIRCDPGSLTCQAWLKIGDPCVAGELKCGGKAHCGAAARCVASPVLGGDCTPIAGEAVFCQTGWCAQPVAPATTRTCVPHAAPGAACDTTNTLQCGLGYTCNVVGAGTAGTCGRNYCGNF